MSLTILLGGLIHLRDGANAQYVTGTAFLFSVYSDLLSMHKQQVTCGNKAFTSSQLMAFAKQQVTTILQTLFIIHDHYI